MTTLLKVENVPSHPSDISELDFSKDLFAQPLNDSWFNLGAWTISPRRDSRGVEDTVSRQSLLIAPNDFKEIFDSLGPIGNAIQSLGKPSDFTVWEGAQKRYGYSPFHKFEFLSTSVTGEPLVFVNFKTSGAELLINPDLWLFLELEEQNPGNGIWWDPRRGREALRLREADDNLRIAEIRLEYLLKYLQARQLSLLVGHYRHLHFFNPRASNIDLFVEGDLTIGTPDQGLKVIVENWGLRKDFEEPFLQRRLHLWFQILPPTIDVEDPWAEQPAFDPYKFTLPTKVGEVAPARWKPFRSSIGRSFDGGVCDFMDRIYFRQDVLTKYEGASGFNVADDGSVSCHHYWGLTRSTSRLGNELLSTAIGDFAEGVPFDEWPHWKQYAVEPPSLQAAAALARERSIGGEVNLVVHELTEMNEAFAALAPVLGVVTGDSPWRGSLDSLAGRQLKWTYPTNATDDEFLKRATLASTLILDGLQTPYLRKILMSIGDRLHLIEDTPPRAMGSRNLLQRIVLIASLISDCRPSLKTIPMLVLQAEGKQRDAQLDMQNELERIQIRVREELGPLAFLYDLRIYGGLAHPPKAAAAGEAAAKLGLPNQNWHRTHYLQLLDLITTSLRAINGRLWSAAAIGIQT